MATLVGYRFHPTDEELVDYYLRHKNLGNEALVKNAIIEIDMCRFDPWDLPSQSKIQSDDDQVWYFFCAKDNKYSNSNRARRTTENGYWKATGRDRKIKVSGRSRQVIGTKKTLVFYKGRVPKGERTDWVVHEYHPLVISPDKRAYVICKLKNKAGGKNSLPSSGGVKLSHPPPPDSENHAFIDTTSEANVQGEESPPESVCDFNGFDDDLGLQWNEQEEGISTLDLQHPIDSSYNHNTLPSQPDSIPQGHDVVNGRDDEFVDSLFSVQEDCSVENNQFPSEPVTGMYPENSTNTDAEKIYSWLNLQEISSSFDDGPAILKERERLLKRESSFSLESFNSQSHPKFTRFTSKECPENSLLQGKLLELEASSDKIDTPTQPPFYSKTRYTELCSELIYSPASSKTRKQHIEEPPFNSKTRNPAFGSNFIKLLLRDSQISIVFKIPHHGSSGMFLKALTSRILIIFLHHLMSFPVQKFSSNYLNKKFYPIPKPANRNVNGTSSTSCHVYIPKGSYFRVNSCDQKHQETRQDKPRNHVRLSVPPRKSLKKHLGKNASSLQIKFKHSKPTQRFSNLIEDQSLFKYPTTPQFKFKHSKHARRCPNLILAQCRLNHPNSIQAQSLLNPSNLIQAHNPYTIIRCYREGFCPFPAKECSKS